MESRVRWTQRVEALERDNAALRRRAEGTDEQQKAFVITLEVIRRRGDFIRQLCSIFYFFIFFII